MNNNPPEKPAGRPMELLAPAGSLAAGYAALHYGADAVYLGLSSFSARAGAVNFSIAELADLAGYAHSLPKRRKIYAAVNTLVLQDELGALIDLLAAIAGIGVDAVIVQDLGELHILRRYFPQVKIHASTQMAIHNLAGVETARQMGLVRVTLARELTLPEIAGIAAQGGIETEVFIHGALCYSYSGLCLFSSHLHGRSGNRGRCAYPCREWFKPSPSNAAGETGGLIFSMKDLALPDHIAELRRAGVSALKIEGRMKSPLYVAAVVNYYRRLIDNRLTPDQARELAADVKTIFSRPWTDLYFRTRKNHDVLDRAITGHRGCPAGKVEAISKYPSGHYLRFQTTLPLELHDGLQIDIAGLTRPFGFAVRSIHPVKGGRISAKKRVFTAAPDSMVEVPLPRDHPAIPLGAVIYSSSSQKVKRQYDFFTPKPLQFCLRQTADFDIKIDANGFEVVARATVPPGTGAPAGAEAKKYFDGAFQPARDISQVSAAIEKTFSKLGATSLAPGKINIANKQSYFISLSLLNAARREITAALEYEIGELSRKYAAIIKAGLFAEDTAVPGEKISSRKDAQEPGPGRFKWSIKTDQPHLLAAFNQDDWRDLDEIIIECAAHAPPDFHDQVKKLADAVGQANIRFAHPPIMRGWETETMTKTVSGLIAAGWRKWQIANLGGWAFLRSLDRSGTPLDISADWPVYVMNRAAVGQLEQLGIRRWTLSPEDGLVNMRALLEKHTSNAVVVVYQDTPLMISETCIFAPEKCSYPNACNFRDILFTSPNGDQIRLVNLGCRLMVLNNQPFCLNTHLDELADAGTVALRVDFMRRAYAEEEALEIWRWLRSGARSARGYPANFERGLE